MRHRHLTGRDPGTNKIAVQDGFCPRAGKAVAAVEKVVLTAGLLSALGAFIYLFPGLLGGRLGRRDRTGNRQSQGRRRAGPGREREIYVDLRTVREHIDPHIYWDELEQTAIITTAERVIHMRSEKVASEINLRPVELEFPPCAGMRRDASFYRCCFWRIFMA